MRELPITVTASRAIALRDGRRLGYAEAAPARGEPVFYLHGAIGTPCRRSPELDATLGELGIRYLMVSRPGYGVSDPLPGRSLLQHAADVEELADALGLERFSVVGVSTGAPYALACAHALPDRVRATAAVSSLSPLRTLALHGVPARLRAARALPEHASRASTKAGGTAVLSFLAAARGGVGKMIHDYRLCTLPWGFEPAAIPGEVHVWHGMRDQLVPVDHALALAASIPRSRISLDPDDGHFFFRRRLREILGGLTEAAGSANLLAACRR
jgi:pimeloyl-ACP methyl ester carboxylesterase